MVFGSFFGARTTCDTVSVFRFSIDRFKGVFVDYCILFILRVFCKKSQIKNYFFYFFYFFFLKLFFFSPVLLHVRVVAHFLARTSFVWFHGRLVRVLHMLL